MKRVRMKYLIELDGLKLVPEIARLLAVPGASPIAAIHQALEEQLLERFRVALGDQVRKLSINESRTASAYDHGLTGKRRTLPDLVKDGFETWYMELRFATLPGARIADITVNGTDLDVIPLHYGGGVKRSVLMKIKTLKTQTNHYFRINHIRIPGRVFGLVLDRLSLPGMLDQPFIANFAPVPIIDGMRVVSFDHLVTGERCFCSCAKPAHQKMLAEANARAPQYASDSWPYMYISLLTGATYLDRMCHLCLARHVSLTEMRAQYGTGVELNFEAFVDQICFDMGIDKRTARVEAMHVLGLSRWVRESTLYGVIRDLFPDQRVLREASPQWLGRLRFDIFLPELKLAVEHQGEQHFRPLKVFGGEIGHARVLERDALKRELCRVNGVTIVDVRYDAPITKVAIGRRLSNFLTPTSPSSTSL